MRFITVLAIMLTLAMTYAQQATILYFTDAHEIAPIDDGARGGMARLHTIIKEVRAQNPETLVLFGGDLVGGTLFGEFQGAPIVEAMNMIGVDYANFGQHEFDFGADVARKRVAESDFQWLTSNLVEATDGSPFNNLPTHVLVEVDGLQIGLLGITTAMNTTGASGQVVATDVHEAAAREVAALRAEGADMVIAVTQQTMAQDLAMLTAVPGIDLVLSEEQSETVTVYNSVGSATVAKPAGSISSVVRVDIDMDHYPVMTFSTIPVDANVPEAPEVAALAERYMQELDERLGAVIATTSVDLDASARKNRTQETLLGNLIADAFRAFYDADIALMNGGGIRSDQVYPAGPLSLKDLTAILPFGSKVVLLQIDGASLRAALENGVSDIANLAGRFPQVSGLSYTFDAAQPVGERIQEVTVNGSPLDPTASYTLATSSYIAGGGDGYSSLADSVVLVDTTNAVGDVQALAEYLRANPDIVPVLEGRITTIE